MITIVDYGAGNITSVRRALDRLGAESEVSADPERVRTAGRIIFPGVGAAGQAMGRLQESGLGAAVIEFSASGKPLLGICLGMQILFDHSDEDGGVDCLGILPGKVVRFPNLPGLTVPHMGWNGVQSRVVKSIKSIKSLMSESRIPFREGVENPWFYFVHSYYVVPDEDALVVGWTEHGVRFASAVQQKNITAVQFHPEKSGEAGEEFLKWWVEGDNANCKF